MLIKVSIALVKNWRSNMGSELIRKHTLLTFYILTCLISWIIWLPLVLKQYGFEIITVPFHHYWGSAGPAVAAILVQLIVGGRAEVTKFLKNLLLVRTPQRWLLIGGLLPFGFVLGGVILSGILEGEWHNISGVFEIEEFKSWIFPTVFLFQVVTFGFGEELGWRGYLLPKLQRNRTVFKATALLTLMWAFWHLPAFFYRPGYLGMGLFEIIGWIFSLFAGAIILTWLFNSSKGSILSAILFHASVEFAFMSNIARGNMSFYIGACFIIFAIAILIISRLINIKQITIAKHSSKEFTYCQNTDGKTGQKNSEVEILIKR